jgi:hypothetical protein
MNINKVTLITAVSKRQVTALFSVAVADLLSDIFRKQLGRSLQLSPLNIS